MDTLLKKKRSAQMLDQGQSRKGNSCPDLQEMQKVVAQG